MKTIEVEVTHHAIPARVNVVHRPKWAGVPEWQTRIEICHWGKDDPYYVHTVADVEALIELLQDAVSVAKGIRDAEETQR